MSRSLGVVTGLAMVIFGFIPFQAMGMSIIVFADSIQLCTLPLVGADTTFRLIVATGFALNLRFVIFGTTIAAASRCCSLPTTCSLTTC